MVPRPVVNRSRSTDEPNSQRRWCLSGRAIEPFVRSIPRAPFTHSIPRGSVKVERVKVLLQKDEQVGLYRSTESSLPKTGQQAVPALFRCKRPRWVLQRPVSKALHQSIHKRANGKGRLSHDGPHQILLVYTPDTLNAEMLRFVPSRAAAMSL